jgi:hypothetical protein
VVYGDAHYEWRERPEALPTTIFVPVSPLEKVHHGVLFATASAMIRALDTGGRDEIVHCAAAFIQAFVGLHPFAFGNMGLAMNIVNWALRRGAGGFVPHTMVDWAAQYLTAHEFSSFFARYCEIYLIRADDLSNAEDVITRMQLMFEFLAIQDPTSVRSWIDVHRDRAELLLLRR